jgi:hypothetical protein
VSTVQISPTRRKLSGPRRAHQRTRKKRDRENDERAGKHRDLARAEIADPRREKSARSVPCTLSAKMMASQMTHPFIYTISPP